MDWVYDCVAVIVFLFCVVLMRRSSVLLDPGMDTGRQSLAPVSVVLIFVPDSTLLLLQNVMSQRRVYYVYDQPLVCWSFKLLFYHLIIPHNPEFLYSFVWPHYNRNVCIYLLLFVILHHLVLHLVGSSWGLIKLSNYCKVFALTLFLKNSNKSA